MGTGNPVGRPRKPERILAGKFTYARFGDRLICFPSEVVRKDELELLKAVNSGYTKGIDTELSEEQHLRLFRIVRDYNELDRL